VSEILSKTLILNSTVSPVIVIKVVNTLDYSLFVFMSRFSFSFISL